MNIRGKCKSAAATLAMAVFTLTAAAQAPPLALKSTAGATVDVGGERGKVVVLSFGATWVPLAARELPALQKLADRYAGRGVQVYWVSVNSAKPGAKNYVTDADLEAFAQKHGLKAIVLRDADQTAYRALGVDALPTVVILDKQGRVARKHVGFDAEQGDAYAEVGRTVEQLLK